MNKLGWVRGHALIRLPMFSPRGDINNEWGCRCGEQYDGPMSPRNQHHLHLRDARQAAVKEPRA
jgi:hypothetical protein